MGQRKHPPLTVSDVQTILHSRGFEKKSQEGSHAHYEGNIGGTRRVVTVDTAKSEFDDFLIKSMIRQSGLTRDEFYGSTKRAAKKAGVALTRSLR